MRERHGNSREDQIQILQEGVYYCSVIVNSTTRIIPYREGVIIPQVPILRIGTQMMGTGGMEFERDQTAGGAFEPRCCTLNLRTAAPLLSALQKRVHARRATARPR